MNNRQPSTYSTREQKNVPGKSRNVLAEMNFGAAQDYSVADLPGWT